MHPISMPLRMIRFCCNYYREVKNANKYGVGFYNFWVQKTPDMWLYQFLLAKNLLNKAIDKKLTFFSVFGPRFKLDMSRGGVNVFYTAENVQAATHRRYRDHAMRNNIDLSVGFEYLTDSKYLRFPLWLMPVFSPAASEQDIINTCARLSFPEIGVRQNFAALVARHDTSGLRKEIYQEISKIDRVDCDGILFQNNDDLKTRYDNNKTEYLKNYRFNICPENSNMDGYVTEKLFDSIVAGCVPIYTGSENCPEPDILNHDAIIFWNPGQKNDDVVRRISDLHKAKTLYAEFASQPRLLPNASDHIIEAFIKLENRFKELLL